MTNQERWHDFEKRVMRRAQELVGNQSPEFNIAPTLELVRHAFTMGYDLIKPAEPAGDCERMRERRPYEGAEVCHEPPTTAPGNEHRWHWIEESSNWECWDCHAVTPRKHDPPQVRPA